MQHEPLSVTVLEACRMLGVGRTKLFQEIAAGRIEARKYGRKTLILVASLRAWLDALPRWASGHDEDH
jgi:excisionase family DNA binding protein